MGSYLLAFWSPRIQGSPSCRLQCRKRIPTDAKLDLSGAAQGDAQAAIGLIFSALTSWSLLTYWTTRPDYPSFFQALPISGKDGTPRGKFNFSPPRRPCPRKTGTFGSEDKLGRKMMLKRQRPRRLRSSPKRERNSPSPLTSITSRSLLGSRAASGCQPRRNCRQPPMTPTWMPRRVQATTISSSATVTSSTALAILYTADVAVSGDRLAAIGDLREAMPSAKSMQGPHRRPRLIDMLGQSEASLLITIAPSATLARHHHGNHRRRRSIAPQNEKTVAPQKPFLDHYKLTIDWTTLDGYFRRLEKQGHRSTSAPMLAPRRSRSRHWRRQSGPDTLRARSDEIPRRASHEGRRSWLSSALIYPPNIYAKTDELIALAQVASKYGGLYATHMRSEGASEMLPQRGLPLNFKWKTSTGRFASRRCDGFARAAFPKLLRCACVWHRVRRILRRLGRER